jgi:hypothetical protein
MDRYHALVSTDAPDGLHKRVSIEAKTLKDAQALFCAEYGADKVVSVWGEREGALPRDE